MSRLLLLGGGGSGSGGGCGGGAAGSFVGNEHGEQNPRGTTIDGGGRILGSSGEGTTRRYGGGTSGAGGGPRADHTVPASAGDAGGEVANPDDGNRWNDENDAGSGTPGVGEDGVGGAANLDGTWGNRENVAAGETPRVGEGEGGGVASGVVTIRGSQNSAVSSSTGDNDEASRFQSLLLGNRVSATPAIPGGGGGGGDGTEGGPEAFSARDHGVSGLEAMEEGAAESTPPHSGRRPRKKLHPQSSGSGRGVRDAHLASAGDGARDGRVRAPSGVGRRPRHPVEAAPLTRPCQRRDWASILSVGEQQRLGIARVLYHRPALAFLDESTSAVTEAAERDAYALMRGAGVTVVAAGHRTSLRALHARVLSLRGAPDGRWDIVEL